MVHSKNEKQQTWIDQLAETIIGSLSQPQETVTRSSITLDSQTINLLILYILMNKETQLFKERIEKTEHSAELEKEIDALIAENKQHFEELMKAAQKGI